ncbi:50S ribosomal protein L19 [Prevotella corporis]|uniref:50S ribosomal protein L19 n=1 Tax=Prevotella corporis TaxID=28128 RepID=UPI0027E40DFA|nr:50S ribosomal protein L19 [Prevotella corporis]MDQ7736492.1 50S ribosomal protein L19 [Prevotella corporis]
MREKLLLVIALAFVQLNMLAQTQEHSDNPLVIIDGMEINDSILQVSQTEMLSDSAKQIVARRLDCLNSYAIDTIIVVDKAAAEKVIICKPNTSGIILIRTNSLAELDLMIDGKRRKPRKRITIIDALYFPEYFATALPKSIHRKKIKKMELLIHKGIVSPERKSMVVITTK